MHHVTCSIRPCPARHVLYSDFPWWWFIKMISICITLINYLIFILWNRKSDMSLTHSISAENSICTHWFWSGEAQELCDRKTQSHPCSKPLRWAWIASPTNLWGISHFQLALSIWRISSRYQSRHQQQPEGRMLLHELEPVSERSRKVLAGRHRRQTLYTPVVRLRQTWRRCPSTRRMEWWIHPTEQG